MTQVNKTLLFKSLPVKKKRIAFSKYNATISDNRGGWYKNLSSAKVVSVPVSVNSASF